jgi:DNA-binding NtrC family response regulator
MMDFNWPGNVRQLEKFISKLVRKYGAQEVGLGDLPDRFTDVLIISDDETDYLLPDLPLINTNIDKVTKDYHNAILEKARSMSNSSVEVDRLLGQNNVEKARQHRLKK